MSKAQAMFEFMLIITVMMLVLSFAIILKNQHDIQANQISFESKAESLCSIISTSIDKVHASGKGSGLNLTIPEKIDFQEYNILVSSENTIVVSHNNNHIFCSFQAKVTNGTSDSFSIAKGILSIYNDGSVVMIS